MEIERKWLVDLNKIPYDLNKCEKYLINQTYISFRPEIRVRDINNGQKYILTIKTKLSEDGLKREEYEVDISQEEYLELLKKKEGNTIYKYRYKIYNNGLFYEIDIYQNELKGLVCLEIEFENEESAKSYVAPDWVEYEITSDKKYKNSYLVQYGLQTKGC